MSALVGGGIKLQSAHSDPTVRAALNAAWERWADSADADDVADAYGLQALAARGMIIDGMPSSSSPPPLTDRSACASSIPSRWMARCTATSAAGTFSALAGRYYASPDYQRLSAESRKNYNRVIDGILAEHGKRRVDQMRREHVDIIVGRMADKPGAGIILLKRLRTLLHYARALGWIGCWPSPGAITWRFSLPLTASLLGQGIRSDDFRRDPSGRIAGALQGPRLPPAK